MLPLKLSMISLLCSTPPIMKLRVAFDLLAEFTIEYPVLFLFVIAIPLIKILICPPENTIAIL